MFIPILLMGGIIGRLFREFAVTLSIAVAISAIVSLTVTPTMAGRLLRPVNDEKLGRFARASERGFAALVRGYDRALRWVLRHALLMLLLTISTLGLTVLLAIRVPKGLFPQQDTGMLAGFSEASQDISSTAMRRAQEKVNPIVQQDPDVEHVIAFVGGRSGAGNTGTVFVSAQALRQAQERPPIRSSAACAPSWRRSPASTLFLQAVQDLRIGGRSSRTQYQYTLEDADLEELQTWAPNVLAKLKSSPSCAT